MPSEDATAGLPLSAAAPAPNAAKQRDPGPSKGPPRPGDRLRAVVAGAHVLRDRSRSTNH
jgi:hypothetical protein